MNWMIDGAHGDLYRRAMGFSQLEPAADEWEIDRNSGRKPHSIRRRFAGCARRLAASLARAREAIRLALTIRETVS